jgi:ATP-dependent helicase/nuclease subunit B
VPPQVVITPLRRALLRPFAAAVLPGADERRLGAPPPPDALLGDTLSLALGLPGVEERRRDEAAAFAHLLRLPQVVLLHRVQDGPEPLAPSLLLERLGALRARAGAPVATAADPRVEQRQPLQPVEPPQPSAATQLPAMLSASTVQALRDCPYRFYARAVLRLREADELDDEAEKRDYGTWLHAVLLRFHAERSGSTAAAEPPLVHLRRLAEDERVAQGIDADSFLPFEASFERFAAHYVRWLQQRETGDAVWLAGEIDREVPLPGVAGIALQGRIDRIDRRSGAHELIDYKTESVVRLKEKVREPLEDTQLAFYAALALLGDEPPPALRATYLALDDPQGIVEVTHENVEASAQVLLDGVAGELQRLRAGAALPALGTGRVCDYCEARGLCRRDHWRDEPPAGGEAAG